MSTKVMSCIIRCLLGRVVRNYFSSKKATRHGELCNTYIWSDNRNSWNLSLLSYKISSKLGKECEKYWNNWLKGNGVTLIRRGSWGEVYRSIAGGGSTNYYSFNGGKKQHLKSIALPVETSSMYWIISLYIDGNSVGSWAWLHRW